MPSFFMIQLLRNVKNSISANGLCYDAFILTDREKGESHGLRHVS